MTEGRPASAAELAALYASLRNSDPALDTVRPTLVVVEPFHGARLATRLAERLRPFGVGVTSLAEAEGLSRSTVYLLGSTLHGWCLDRSGEPDGGDEERDFAAVGEVVEAARLRTWAAATLPEPVFTRTHRPGSDSTGVIQFNAGKEIVAKIGGLDVIEPERQFVSRTNDELTRAGCEPLFPRLYGIHTEGSQAASLMEAAGPADLTDQLFEDAARTKLRADAVGTLMPYLDQLSSWYRLTATPRQPTVGDYLYRERFHALRDFPAFRSTFHAFFPDADLDEALGADVLLPDGVKLRGYTEASEWLNLATPSLLPRSGSSAHGDVNLTNMLRRTGGGPVLIDPRTLWEGRDRPDVGYGDPVFDLATLLHGLLPMAAVLEAAHSGTAERLFATDVAVRAGGGPHDLSSLRLPLRFSDELLAVERQLITCSPGDEPPERVRCRLYLGAASSLGGWLKYEHSMRTRYAWLATYAYMLWYVERARTVYEKNSLQEGCT
ncbi:phosphotransferase [Streptomyces sp. N2-109]|uniref:Phosphotransferase n=1 Tax=Streptomyces gossypii TaxID=2883101 RepID=A0ABT2K294_9ACTN|nr:phosphotransferase [Streptomyces gossypii]MCT2594018.1 phosphotransferase [Streptomyces gossypii]